MKDIRRLLKFAFFAAVVTAALTLLCFAAALPSVKVKSSAPPVAAVADYGISYGWRVGGDIEVYTGSGKHYLFLPSSAELSAVKMTYTGSQSYYDAGTGRTYKKGESFTLDCTGGSVYIYELTSSGVYNRYSLKVMKASAKAALYITLSDGDKTLLKINSDHQYVGTGEITMVKSDGKRVYSGAMTRLKGHGLTSYEGSGKLDTKNSYNMNIETKTELVEGAGKSRKWTLLRIRTNGSYDATGLSYLTAFSSYNALAGEDYFNMRALYTDVYIDGEYRGVYILSERMDVNGAFDIKDLEQDTLFESTSLVTIKDSKFPDDPAISAGIESYSYCSSATLADGVDDITGGYVLEIMCGTYGECGFKTENGMYVNIKSPAYCTREQAQYIAEYVQQFENALFSRTGYNSLGLHYSDYADLDSLAMQTLIYAYYLNWEIYRTSTYMFKDADGEEHDKLTFGPVWDFESGPYVMWDGTLFGTTFSYTERQQYIWFQQLWQKGDFMAIITSMNENRLKPVLEQLNGVGGKDIYSLSSLIDEIAGSQQMNWIRWSQPDSYEKRADMMLEALEYRFEYWYDTLWNPDSYLLGVEIVPALNKDGSLTLTAKVSGSASSYKWYKMSGGRSLTVVSGGKGAAITVEGDGTYICAVSGANNAYWEGASGDIFSSKTITMWSAALNTADAVKAISNIDADDGDGEPQTSYDGEAARTPEAGAAAITQNDEIAEDASLPPDEGLTEEKLPAQLSESAAPPSSKGKYTDAFCISATALIVLASFSAAYIVGRKVKGAKTDA